jgi:hypothetical protein
MTGATRSDFPLLSLRGSEIQPRRKSYGGSRSEKTVKRPLRADLDGRWNLSCTTGRNGIGLVVQNGNLELKDRLPKLVLLRTEPLHALPLLVFSPPTITLSSTEARGSVRHVGIP